MTTTRLGRRDFVRLAGMAGTTAAAAACGVTPTPTQSPTPAPAEPTTPPPAEPTAAPSAAEPTPTVASEAAPITEPVARYQEAPMLAEMVAAKLPPEERLPVDPMVEPIAEVGNYCGTASLRNQLHRHLARAPGDVAAMPRPSSQLACRGR